jgi:hypothetical protein
MTKPATASRLGPIVTLIAIVVLDVVLTGRYRLAPSWLTYLAASVMLIPMLIHAVARSKSLWQRVERATTMITIALILLINALNLIDVVDELLFHPSDLRPMSLVLTSISIWVCNMLAFTLLYWEIDRGGPDARARREDRYADFDFPAADDPRKVPPGWQPGFVDYLFIGFTTSTAFGPTEAMPLTTRAKALMIVQSVISLVTIVVVAARAIGLVQ